MQITFQKLRRTALSFLFSLVFINLYAALFGRGEALAGVTILIGLTTFPACDLNVKPRQMAGVIVVLYTLSGLVAHLTLQNLALGVVLNFAFVCAILLLSTEPLLLRPYACFMLGYVFCLASPVDAGAFGMRMLGLTLGALLIAGVSLVQWTRRGLSCCGHSVREQVQLCAKNNRGFILRMACGVTLAALAAGITHLQKPLWLIIVVYSLTQPAFHDMVLRIKYRTIGTLLGALLFLVVFRVLVPEKYAIVATLCISFLASLFASQYQYQQLLNAMNALYSSLALLDTSVAIGNRIACLIGGIAIVLAVHGASRAAARFAARRRMRTAQ